MSGSNQGGRGPSDEGRRPTKAERREEARLKREEIQRRMAGRRRNRTIGLALLVTVLVVVVVAVFLTSGGNGTSGAGIPSADTLLSRAGAATDAAGCDTVQETPNYSGAASDQAHIGSASSPSAPELSSYATIPAASGPMAASPLAAGIYDSPPDAYQPIHGLEHGGVIVWYSPDADPAKVADLKAFYAQRQSDVNIGQDRVIVAPYDYPGQGDAAQLPAGVQMALVGWHRLQTCASVSLPVAFDFASQYASPTYSGRTYKGVAPEAGAGM